MDPRVVLSSIALGFAYAAAPGVVNTESLRRGIARGGRSAFLVQAGSLLGDLVWAVLGLTGAALVAATRPARIAVGLAGAAFVLRLAWLGFEDARARRPPRDTGARFRGDLLTGVVFGLANPVGLAFWAGVGTLASGSGFLGLAEVLAGFAAGALAWVCGFPLLIAFGRRIMGERSLRWIRAGSAAILAFYGLRMLWDSVHLAVETFTKRVGPKAMPLITLLPEAQGPGPQSPLPGRGGSRVATTMLGRWED